VSDDFEPALGRTRRDTLRPQTQLRRLKALARWGKTRTDGRRRFAAGEIFRKGRGKGAAAVAEHWSSTSSRRVFVRSSFAAVRGRNTSSFAGHIRYILRDQTDEDGKRGALYSRDADAVDASEFISRSREDPWQFRLIVSPEDAHQIENISAFTRKLMLQVERDLRTPVDWVAVDHYNTAHPHTHIVIRGRTPDNQELLIARRYNISGLRHRAEEILTDLLGPKTWRELSAARTNEQTTQRVTSLDVQISRAASFGRLRLAQAASAAAPHGLAAQVKRLQYLEKLGLAEHVYGQEWRLNEGWKDVLNSLGKRTDTLIEMGKALGDYRTTDRLELITPAGDEKWVTGRLVALSAPDAGPPDPLLVLDGLDGRIWLARAPKTDTLQLPRPGGILSVLIGPAPAAAANAPSEITEPGSGEPAAQTIRVFVNSWLPVDQLVERRAFTWLDEISETQLAGTLAGFGLEVRAAKSARQAFLAATALDLSDIDTLRGSELERAARDLSGQTGKRYAELASREVFRGEYTGHVDTAYGRFAIISNETRFTFSPLTDALTRLKGKTVLVEQGPVAAGNLLWRARGIER